MESILAICPLQRGLEAAARDVTVLGVYLICIHVPVVYVVCAV